MKLDMDASVIICTYNRASSLRRTLESLRRMTVPPDLEWELVVVDNNSSDNTRCVVEAFARDSGLNVRYLFEGRQGLSHARNRGVLESRGDVISFLDDDVLVAADWMIRVREAFDRFNPACVGGRVLLKDDLPLPAWWDSNCLGPAGVFDRGDSVIVGTADDNRLVGIGANISFRRSVFDRHGLFDTKLGRKGKALLTGEEVDVVERLRKANEVRLYLPGAAVIHSPGPSRFTKQYHRRWWYRIGSWQCSVEGAAPLRRTLTTAFLQALRSSAAIPVLLVLGDRQRAFRHELNVCRQLGYLTAAPGKIICLLGNKLAVSRRPVSKGETDCLQQKL